MRAHGYFINYLKIDQPFALGPIDPVRELTVIIPEKVRVGVQTDLNFDRPAVRGNLDFQRTKYVEDISDAIERATLPKGKKRKKQ